MKIKKLSALIAQDFIDDGLGDFVGIVNSLIEKKLSNDAHGDYSRWIDAIEQAPPLSNIELNFSSNAIHIQGANGDDEILNESLQVELKKLKPWRKGPYQFLKTYVDTEWRSDFKWDRLKNHINLKNKRVLDIGCGNGYHCWRMLEKQPKWVLGVDPNVLFNIQFRFVNHYAQREDIAVVPLAIEDLPQPMNFFDRVFSMGVLYHRKSPIDHLYELKSLLCKDGELILETLVIEGGEQDVLVPKGRYAQMKNVWFIPSVAALQVWLIKVGFKTVELIDVSRTTTKEQRQTEWMTFDSLDHFLDSDDSSLTLEGYPAPMRAVLIAKR